ncbi:MAG TPA: response regulator transcription factor [Pseudonocardiaceae bacterium]
MAVRVLLCDRNAFSRVGLRTVLNGYPTIRVVGEVADGADAMAAALRLRPEVVLADVGLPPDGGVELTRRLLERASHVRGLPGGTGTRGDWRPAVILMTPLMDGAIVDSLRAGVSAILVKDCPAEEFVRAIEVVVAGGGFLAPPVVRHLVDQLSGAAPAQPTGTGADQLTPREWEVLALVAEGLSNVEIGRRLFVGEPTVKYHVSQLLRKLALRDRLQLAAYAYRNGLVTR